MNIVVKLGGHLIFNEELDIELLERYSEIFRELYDGGRWVVVVGGGRHARRYVESARKLGLSESICDEIGIKITRINASILSSLIGEKAYPLVPENLDQLRAYSTHGKIVIMGGLQPGQSTMAVSALAAETIGAEKLIIATDVDGIYTADPKKDPTARMLKEVSVKELIEKLIDYSHEAGEYKLADLTGLKIIARSRIPTIYLNGKNPENLIKALRGERVGTLVKP
ncbi:MAG: UMP kinase [Candidatus Caldarchaeales archaeon]